MAIRYLSGVNIDTNTFFVDSTNNKVGIGTGTPSAKLDIDGAHVASIGLLRLNSSAANMSAMTYYIDGVYKAATYAGTDDNFYVWGRDADIVFNTTTSGTTRMVITNGGNVGIGTTGPTQKLMVGGSIRVTGGYYDSSNSIGSNGQVLASTGTGTAWINVSGGTVNGSGTVNYLSKWTGTTLLGDSLIYDNGTYVGIGTTAPGAKLDVLTADPIRLRSSGTTGYGAGIDFYHSSSYRAYVGFPDTSAGIGPDQLLLYTGSAYPISFYTNNTERVRITSGGNVGIGNTSPSQKLHVEGNIRVTGAYYDSANVAGSSGQVLSSTGSGTSWITPFSGSGTTNYVAKWTSGTALGNSQIFDNGTNVGIGTASPAEKLQVNGLVRITNPTYAGIEYHNTNGTWELYVGTESGGSGARYNSASSRHTFYNNSSAVLSIVSSNVGIGTTSPSRMLHVAGNAQVDGWLFQGGYYTGSVTLPYPGANYGNGRIYLRLCSSASGRIMTAKVRISSTWNWAPAFGSVEADISFYWDGSSLVYSYVNILSATGQAATNLTFGALEVEGGSISVPVYSTNSNPIYAYIQLSADADPSQVSYSTWSSVAFPGQANVYVQTSLGVGTTSPSAPFHVYKNVGAGDYVAYIQNTGGGNGLKIYNADWDTTDYLLYATNGGTSTYGYAFVVDGNARVGIGNTAPSQLLHVTGNVRVTGAYYDSSNAAGTSGQILSSTGTGTAWISPGGGGGIITGSGTTNYVTKWTSGTAVGDSSIFDNGTSVGVGTATPVAKLDVNGTFSLLAGAGGYWLKGEQGNSTPGGNSPFLALVNNNSIASATYGWLFYDSNADGSFNLYRRNNSTTSDQVLTISRSTGNVGIGTTTPQKPLEVISGVNDFVSVGVNQISVGNWTGIHFGYREANSSYRKSAIVFERTDLTANDAQGKIHILNGPQGSGGSATLADAKLTIAENGNVGIGTTSPLKKLVVTTGNNTNSSSNKSDALAYFGGGNDNPNAQNISFPNPSITDLSIPGMYWWSADVMFGRYKNEAFWSIKETHGGALGGSQRDIIRSYFYDSGGYTYIDKTVIPNGNVGIGTTAPGAKLEIAGTNSTLALSFGNSVPNNPLFINTYGGWSGIGMDQATAGLRLAGDYGSVSNPLVDIGYYSSGVVAHGNWVQRFRILNNGNVGIGETAPSQKLHVSGNIRVTGAYYDSANSAGTSGQILSSTGTGTAWIAAPSGGGVTGSGTTNYVTKWTSGSAVGDSVMYDNGTNVVIGSTVANPVGSASPAALTLRKFTSGNATTVLSSSYYLGVGGNEYTVNSYRLIGFGYAEVSSTSTYPAYIGYQEKTTSGYTYGDLIFGTRSTTGAGDNPVERMRIDYNGNVGIGTTSRSSPFTVATDVRAASLTATDLRPQSQLNLLGGGGDSLFIGQLTNSTVYMQSSYFNATLATYPIAINPLGGNVGIGTTAPSYKLDVDGGSAGDAARFYNSSNAATVVRIGDSGNSDYSDLLLQTNSGTGEIFKAGTGYASYGGALALNIYNSNGPIAFHPNNTANAMFISNNSNIGINTTSPQTKLNIDIGAGGANGTAAFRVGAISNYPSLELGIVGDYGGMIRSYGNDLHYYAGHWRTVGTAATEDHSHYWYTSKNGSTDWSTPKMELDHNGNLGIGTTAPGQKLQVDGNIYVNDDGTTGNGIMLRGADRPLIARGWDPFTSGNKTGVGRWGVYMESAELFIGAPGTDYSNALITLGGWLLNGTRQPNLTLNNSTQRVGIGTTSPGYKLDVSGTIRATGDVIAYSDARVKENVETLDGALDKVMKMRGVSYNKIGEQEKKVGVIAQEILEVLPEVVSQDETGTYSVAYGNISAVLIEAIKELTNTVKEQQKQIDELKSKLK